MPLHERQLNELAVVNLQRGTIPGGAPNEQVTGQRW
jgi:hypothetical protein